MSLDLRRIVGKLTIWKCLAGIILAAGAYSAVVRFTSGLGRVTHLDDRYPWGLWIGFDVLCGVGLAAGGFTIAALVHLFNRKRFEPVLRPAILTAFLGNLLVMVGLVFDLGRPLAIWHPAVMWNPHSVMFTVAWCLMLYTTVLALEFAPVLLERFRMERTIGALRRATVPIVLVGVLLSTLHQSSLGSLFLIMPDKLYPLWYSPFLPVFFFLSALAAGCAMVIFESSLSARVLHRGLDRRILEDMGSAAAILLLIYLALRVVDVCIRGIAPLLFLPRMETCLYWFEMVVGVIVPAALLSHAGVRKSGKGIYWSAITVIVGFVAGRLNVALTGMQASAGLPHYFPSWMEISITLAIVTFGFAVFALAAKHLSVYGHEPADWEHLPQDWLHDLVLVSRPPETISSVAHGLRMPHGLNYEGW